MAYSGVATLGFIGTNSNKVFGQGDWTRIPVLAGQVINAGDEATKLSSTLSGQTYKILQNCDTIAKTDKAFGFVYKAGKFIKNNINPLIIASSAIKVALTPKEEREKALITETGTIGGMFLAEGFMKKNLQKYLDKLPVNKKFLPIIKGITFIAGSLAGCAIGNKIGKNIANLWNTPLDKNHREKKELALKEQEQQLNIKA